MINSNIGYIICESDVEAKPVNIVKNKINNKLVAEGILQTADEKNRNGRYYAEEELFPQLTAPRTVELLKAGYLRAEMGHPLSKDLARQSTIDDTKTCARFLKLWTVGKDVWATFTGTNNVNGEAFNADLAEGCLPAWSLRALGSVEQTRRGAEVKHLRLITWDQVIYPSHPGAYTQRVLSEAAAVEDEDENDIKRDDISESGILIPITNNDVISFLQTESSNLKLVRECFDFVYSGITVNKDGTKVLLTTNAGDTMVVNMESYIHNEIMNFAVNKNKF
jgi:hypothetical protein